MCYTNFLDSSWALVRIDIVGRNPYSYVKICKIFQILDRLTVPHGTFIQNHLHSFTILHKV